MLEAWELPGVLDGERLDRALALLTGCSRRQADELIDEGRVTLDDRVMASRTRRVRAGERLSVAGPVVGPRSQPLEGDVEVEITVVWSDDAVIVVDKPAGLVVHPGAANRTGTLVQGLLARFPDLAALADGAGGPGGDDRPGIVHRLDKGTSGLLVVARTNAARKGLVAQLAARQVGREYVALVAGTVEADAGLIDAPLGRADRDPTRVQIHAGGRPARTRYQVKGRYSRPLPTTLVRCRLETGRTHQIRVHLASIGHPVIGDHRYGGAGLAGWKPLAPGRHFLHAATLAFDHPSTGERLSFSSDPPADLRAVLDEVSGATGWSAAGELDAGN
jgi:23S rRNA pseudouridine1911/1915/1917 synthase